MDSSKIIKALFIELGQISQMAVFSGMAAYLPITGGAHLFMPRQNTLPLIQMNAGAGKVILSSPFINTFPGQALGNHGLLDIYEGFGKLTSEGQKGLMKIGVGGLCFLRVRRMFKQRPPRLPQIDNR